MQVLATTYGALISKERLEDDFNSKAELLRENGDVQHRLNGATTEAKIEIFDYMDDYVSFKGVLLGINGDGDKTREKCLSEIKERINIFGVKNA